MKVDKMPNLLIGTSGYDYPEWKGVFYPEDLKRKDFLIFYATQFNALELNNTFYDTLTFYNGTHKTRNGGGCFYGIFSFNHFDRCCYLNYSFQQ